MKCIKRQQQRCLSERARMQRLVSILGIAMAWAFVLIGRLYFLQSVDANSFRSMAENQHLEEIKVSGERGVIMDRHGNPLAMSIPAASLFVHPHKVKEPVVLAKKLSPILGMSQASLEAKFRSTAPFVWLKRKVDRDMLDQVEALGYASVESFPDSLRKYPYGSAAGVLLGSTGMDGYGLSGIEAVYNSQLSGSEAHTLVSRDGRGKRYAFLDTQDPTMEVPQGGDVRLSLDVDLQVIVDEELEKGKETANAKAAMAVMMDAETGEILALSQAPGFNFNDGSIDSKDQLKNRVIETVFEPGSTMKPLVVAAALELGAIHETDVLDCESGRFRFGRNIIKDVHGYDRLSVEDVVVRSSNIGMSKIGILMGKDNLYKSLRAFGFGQAPGLQLPGETAGILRPVQRWSSIDVATHAFGQGVAVTAVQMVRAVSAIANGGTLPPVTLVVNNKPRTYRRIIKETTAEKVQTMMESVVQSERGTGKRARIEGVLIGGKTGTAQKAKEDGRGYAQGKYVASFVGYMKGASIGIDRTLTLIVVIDEPNTTSIYGGTLAAPVFQRIMNRSIATLKDRQHLRYAGPQVHEHERMVSYQGTAPVLNHQGSL